MKQFGGKREQSLGHKESHMDQAGDELSSTIWHITSYVSIIDEKTSIATKAVGITETCSVSPDINGF